MQAEITQINRKFNEEEEKIKVRLEDIVTKLQIASKSENEFLSNLYKVDSIYSPVKDSKDSEIKSKEVLKSFNETQKILDLEKSKLENMQKKLKDNNIKVALFGDVSAGKSQTINSILGRKLFIPAYCHTTICFVRISLSNDFETVTSPDGEVKTCETEEDLRLRIKDHANFNGLKKLKPNEVLKIGVKKQNNDKIMRENVTLIDCPGGNDTQEVTDMIENVVVEADIFLYILTQVIFEQQRTFFNQLMTKTSAPNIFVLVNKWDETDNDEPSDTAKAYDSLQSEISTWLTAIDSDNKKLCNDRIFFISAKETLQNKTGSVVLTEPQKKRIDEFARFEKIFGEHLDNPKEIKINKHIKEFEKMNTNIEHIIQINNERLKQLRDKKSECEKIITEKIDKLELVKTHLSKDTVDKIEKLEPAKYDEFFKTQLKLIEKEMNNFSDVLHEPEPSVFGKLTSFVSWGWSKVHSEDPIYKHKEDLIESMMNHIKKEMDIIREPLQNELDYYTKYLAELQTIQ